LSRSDRAVRALRRANGSLRLHARRPRVFAAPSRWAPIAGRPRRHECVAPRPASAGATMRARARLRQVQRRGGLCRRAPSCSSTVARRNGPLGADEETSGFAAALDRGPSSGPHCIAPRNASSAQRCAARARWLRCRRESGFLRRPLLIATEGAELAHGRPSRGGEDGSRAVAARNSAGSSLCRATPSPRKEERRGPLLLSALATPERCAALRSARLWARRPRFFAACSRGRLSPAATVGPMGCAAQRPLPGAQMREHAQMVRAGAEEGERGGFCCRAWAPGDSIVAPRSEPFGLYARRLGFAANSRSGRPFAAAPSA
jgi:hypothetical protein